MSDQIRLQSSGTVQDTGNPVLDTTANILRAYLHAGKSMNGFSELAKGIHQMVMEMAEKEPGGLVRRNLAGEFNPVPIEQLKFGNT